MRRLHLCSYLEKKGGGVWGGKEEERSHLRHGEKTVAGRGKMESFDGDKRLHWSDSGNNPVFRT